MYTPNQKERMDTKFFIVTIIGLLIWVAKELYKEYKDFRRQNCMVGYINGILEEEIKFILKIGPENTGRFEETFELLNKGGEEAKKYRPFLVHCEKQYLSFDFIKDQLNFFDSDTMSRLIKFVSSEKLIEEYNCLLMADTFAELEPKRKAVIMRDYQEQIDLLIDRTFEAYDGIQKFTEKGIRERLLYQLNFSQQFKAQLKSISTEIQKYKNTNRS